MHNENFTWNLGYMFINFLEIELALFLLGPNNSQLCSSNSGFGVGGNTVFLSSHSVGKRAWKYNALLLE